MNLVKHPTYLEISNRLDHTAYTGLTYGIRVDVREYLVDMLWWKVHEQVRDIIHEELPYPHE